MAYVLTQKEISALLDEDKKPMEAALLKRSTRRRAAPPSARTHHAHKPKDSKKTHQKRNKYILLWKALNQKHISTTSPSL